jgi:hypothetical protein|tara:strand:- start:455 stop:631 length:177 start_codon:yes stop_codon:yes gene_type:complete
MDWNIILYIGIILIVSGFGLFILSELRIREIDRQLFLNEQLIKSFNKNKENNKHASNN